MSDRFPNVLIHPSAEVEDDVQIDEQQNLASGAHPQRDPHRTDLHHRPQRLRGHQRVHRGRVQDSKRCEHLRGVTLEDLVFVGPAVTFTNDL